MQNLAEQIIDQILLLAARLLPGVTLNQRGQPMTLDGFVGCSSFIARLLFLAARAPKRFGTCVTPQPSA
jgi:hypothetical protein